MSSLRDALALIPDYRAKRGVRYSLADLHFMMICTILCGKRTAVDISYFIELHFGDFKKLLGIPGTPSHDTISRVFIFTDWSHLTKHLTDWFYENYPAESTLYQKMKVLHIDGKAIRSSADGGQKPPYQLNCMEEGKAISFGSLPIGEKDNEITAIPKLLDLLDIADAIVTIDAIGCQRKILERILAKKGHFMIPVKENQRNLLEACRAERNRLTAEGKWGSLPSCTLMKSDHGRIENYSLTVMEDTSFLLEEFPVDDVFLSIGRIGYIHKTVTEKRTEETAESETYVVTDLCTRPTVFPVGGSVHSRVGVGRGKTEGTHPRGLPSFPFRSDATLRLP